MSYSEGAKFCNNVLSNFITPHMALMTKLQTPSSSTSYLHKHSYLPALLGDPRRWVMDKMVLMTMPLSPETSGTPGDGHQWSPVIGAGGASDQISLLSSRHCCLPLLGLWWPLANQRPCWPGSDQWEASVDVTRSLHSIGPESPGTEALLIAARRRALENIAIMTNGRDHNG